MALSYDRLIKNFEKKYREISKIIGVSAVISYKDGYLFTLEKEKYWEKRNNSFLIKFTAVGGRLEKNETFIDAMQRESDEEIGCKLNLIDSKKTVYINFNSRIKEITLAEKTKPIIIYEKIYKGLPGLPHTSGKWVLFCPVFFAMLKRKPKPSSEIPALLILPKNLFALCKKQLKLRTILERGGILIEAKSIPKTAFIQPMFTPEILLKSNIKIEDLL
ncbi:MAG: NUDIX domain-containing protein [Candidatus Omnitrophica bacterium]|nr:NUDIX domain-containing protein [Candidatus Omnitrophota bacterium]